MPGSAVNRAVASAGSAHRSSRPATAATRQSASARRCSNPSGWKAQYGAAASASGAGGSHSRSTGPGAGDPNRRTIAAYARYASLPVTFCSQTARSRRGNTRPVAGSRTPRWVRARSATTGWAAASAWKPSSRSRRPAIASAWSTTQPAPGPYPVATSVAPSRCSRRLAGPAGVGVASQYAPSKNRAHGSCRPRLSWPTVAENRYAAGGVIRRSITRTLCQPGGAGRRARCPPVTPTSRGSRTGDARQAPPGPQVASRRSRGARWWRLPVPAYRPPPGTRTRLQAEFGFEVARLQALLDGGEEPHRVRTVHQPVVVGEREVHHGPRHDDLTQLRVVDHHRPLDHGAGPQDGDLRLVDDRGVEERPPAAGVGQRERAAGELVRADLVSTGPLRHVRDPARESGEVQVTGVADDRHHQ